MRHKTEMKKRQPDFVVDRTRQAKLRIVFWCTGLILITVAVVRMVTL